MNTVLRSIQPFTKSALSRAIRTPRTGSRVALALLTLAATGAHAQANRTSAHRIVDLQVGGYFSFAPKPDYTPATFYGGGAYVVYDFKHNFGVEGNFHQVNGPLQINERTIEVGGRYVKHFSHVDPYIRLSYGRGTFNAPNSVSNQSYNLVAGGVGADILLTYHLNVRADYDIQYWPGFKGQGTGSPANGLEPNVASVGLAYHF